MSVRYEGAYMFETGPDGMVFLADIFKNQGFFHVVVRVMGWKQAAKKYRVELRISSNKSSVSLTHSGPVFPIGYSFVNATKEKNSFKISCSKFASFNKGKAYFGKNNLDKNGETVLPLSVKIKKKNLGVSTDYTL